MSYECVSTHYHLLSTIYQNYPLPTTHYSLLTTHYSLPTTHYPLLTTHYPLPTTHYPLPTTHYHLHRNTFFPILHSQTTRPMKHTIWIGLVMSIISAYTGRANTPQNAEFIALYQAIINGGLTEPEGSGKANAALSTISSIAYNSNSSLNKLAESILAVYKNYEYVRHGQPVLLKPQSPKKDKSIFYIMPNPATTSVVCKLWQPLEQHSRLLVSDFSGRIVISVFVPSASLQVALDISQLNNGIYFCRLDGTGSVQKLVVVK